MTEQKFVPCGRWMAGPTETGEMRCGDLGCHCDHCAEIGRLREDAARLDWIERRDPLGLLDVMSTDAGVGYGFTSITGDQTLYESFRSAIDAAREADSDG